MRAVGRLAADLDCAFVVVCGDVFEPNQIDRQVLVRALDSMAAVPVPLYVLPGNHDPLDAASIYRSGALRQHVPGHVQVLDTFEFVPAAPGVWLHPAPWTSKRPLKDLAARDVGLAQGEPGAHILVGHGMVDVLSPGATDPAASALAGRRGGKLA